MQEEAFRQLLNKYTQGQCSPEEVAWLENAYQHWNEAEPLRFSEEEYQHVQELMWSKVEQATRPVMKQRLWPKIAVAAAAVATMVFGLYFFKQYESGQEQHPAAAQYANDIAPGTYGATLTLANGKTIPLSESKSGVMVSKEQLTYNDNSPVSASEKEPLNGQNLTAVTAKGQTYQFTLPDGTRVWLNADSKLEFPSQFSGKERKIMLDGEGYFEVAKDKAHPFIVESRQQEVEVLGTHFNISAYGDEGSVKTTLLEGSVRVRPMNQADLPQDQAKNNSSVILKPNQQLIFNQSLKIIPIDAEAEVAWKNGKFVFTDEPIESIMRKISRWYDVEVVYEGGAPSDEFGGTVSRFSNVSQVLKKLELTNRAHFKIEGRKIIVTK